MDMGVDGIVTDRPDLVRDEMQRRGMSLLAQEAVRDDAAFNEGVELVLHELRQIGRGGGFGLGEPCRACGARRGPQ
jgi:hypothetical protein